MANLWSFFTLCIINDDSLDCNKMSHNFSMMNKDVTYKIVTNLQCKLLKTFDACCIKLFKKILSNILTKESESKILSNISTVYSD